MPARTGGGKSEQNYYTRAIPDASFSVRDGAAEHGRCPLPAQQCVYGCMYVCTSHTCRLQDTYTDENSVNTLGR